jgi:protein SCO1/2
VERPALKQLAQKWRTIKWPLLFGLLSAFVLATASAATAPARADHAQPDPAEGVEFEQRLGETLPLELSFKDEGGQAVRLADYFAGKPVILVFAYYECPMLCTLVLNDLAEALHDLAFEAGEQFEVVTVSFDPQDGPAQASQKKALYLEALNRPGAEKGWHFLTGDQAAISALTGAAGFQYRYVEDHDEYAHPTGVLILTPDGRVSRYILGIDYSSKDLRLGLVEAADRKIATLVDQFYLLCYDYDPVTGRYTLLVHRLLQIGGAITVFGLGLFVFFLRKAEKRQPL